MRLEYFRCNEQIELYVWFFDVVDGEPFLPEISVVSPHETVAVSVIGTSSISQKESNKRHCRPLQQRSSLLHWWNRANSKWVDERTVERDLEFDEGNQRTTEDSSSHRIRGTVWRRQERRDQTELDAGSCSLRPHLFDFFRHRFRYRNSCIHYCF